MKSALFTEDFAGLRTQALGLAERAGLAPAVHVLQPRGAWSVLPARFWPDPARITGLAAPLPELVIGCGGVAAAVGAQLQRGGHLAVQVQHPRMNPARFALVVANRHDELTGPNVVVTRTAMHQATPLRLAEARARWTPAFAHLPRPLVCVLVGGSNGRFRLDAAVGAALAGQLAAMMRREHVGVALTPSRRTAPVVVAQLRESLTPLGAWVWDGQGDNPYFGLLALADCIIVTGDSVSMMSEAAATAAPVLVAPLPGRSRRIALFTAGLLAERRIRLYAGRCETWPSAPLDDTDMAAAALRDRLGC